MSQIDHRSYWGRAAESIKQFIRDEKNAVSLKCLIYCFHGGAVCIFPLIVLQMQLWGISVKELAAVALIQPIASLLGPVCSGLVADKFGKYGMILVINIFLTTLCYDLLLAVPKVPTLTASVVCLQNDVLMDFSHCDECFQHLDNDTVTLESNLVQNTPLCGNATNSSNCANSSEQVVATILPTGRVCSFEMLDVTFCENMTMDEPFTRNSWKIIESTSCPKSMDANTYSSSFYIFLLIRTFGSFFTTAAFTMLDASIIAVAKKHSLSLGKQRVFVMLGYATTPPFAGYISDHYSAYIGHQSFLPNFIIGTILLMMAAILMSLLNVKVDQNNENVIKNFKYLLSRAEVLLFLVMLLLLGCNFGFIESYLFLFMNSLKAPSVALGLTITSGCLASIPVLYYSDYINSKVGRDFIYLICFTAYAIRLAGYSFIRNPWLALIFEMIESINYQLMWVTSLMFFPKLAPPGMLATMTGLSMAVHYAFGQGVGAFVGGYLIDEFGYRVTFRLFAVASVVSGIICFVAYRLVIKKRTEPA